MTGITWLHLSDWHQKGKELDFNKKRVLDELIKDIRSRVQISEELEKIDFIVFSGDVAFSGKQEEYEAAQEYFFKRILEAAGIEEKRLFIIPGNHDLDQSVIEGEIYPTILKKTFESEEKVQEYLTETKKRQLILDPFEAYQNFVAKYTGQETPNYSCFLSQKTNGKKVAFLGINSALMAGRKNVEGKVDDRGKLIVGEPQIDDYLQHIKDHDIKIAVMHHPLDWLAEFDRNRVEQRLISECDFILCGHLHKDQAQQIIGTSGDCVIISAGASYNSRESPNGYNFVHLDFDRGQGTVYLRRWEDELSKWTKKRYLGKSEEVVDTGKYNFKLSSKNNSSQTDAVGLNKHYKGLVGKLKKGLVVPFLGAEINLCGRPEEQITNPWEWQVNGGFPPTNLELAAYIAKVCGYLEDVRCPLCDRETFPCDSKDPKFPGGFPQQCPYNTKNIRRLDLSHVSQYFWSKEHGFNNKFSETFKNSINNIYRNPYQPNRLHKFLAILPHVLTNDSSDGIRMSEGYATPYPLIVTTCFDQTLESAFKKVCQPFNLVSYSSFRQTFLCQQFFLDEDAKNIIPDTAQIIKEPSDYVEVLSLKKCPVIFRFYGPVEWGSSENEGENFAITEDHLIDYLNFDIAGRFPIKLWNRLISSHLWFLGYSLSHWNLRIIPRKIRLDGSFAFKNSNDNYDNWWAIQEKPELLDEELWKNNGVNLFSTVDSQNNISSLEQYIVDLAAQIGIEDIDRTFEGLTTDKSRR